MKPSSGNDDALRLLRVARTGLLMAKGSAACFYAVLALKLKPAVMPAEIQCTTAATDGRHIWVWPKWWNALTAEERVGVVCHEVLHCAWAHQSRRGNRDCALWNVAGDLAINCLIEDSGFTLPKCRLMPGEAPVVPQGQTIDPNLAPLDAAIAALPKGLSSEAYYERLQPEWSKAQAKMQNQQGDGTGKASCDLGGCGSVQDAAHDPAGNTASEQDWKEAVVQAARQAKQRGLLPGSLGEWLAELEKPRIDPRDVLVDFLQRVLADDYSWSHPSRRHIGRGVYLPGMESEGLPFGVLTIDSSGSVRDRLLMRYLGWVQAVIETHPAKLLILLHDTDVYAEQEWQPGEGDLVVGQVRRGGTSHKPAFERIAECGDEPAFVLAFTDLETEFPEHPPGCPVLWLTTKADEREVPFGTVLPLVEGE